MSALSYIDRPTARFLDSPRLSHGMPQYKPLFEHLNELEEYKYLLIYSKPQLLQGGLFYVNTFFRWKSLVLHVKKSGFGKIIISYQSDINMNFHIIIVLVF